MGTHMGFHCVEGEYLVIMLSHQALKTRFFFKLKKKWAAKLLYSYPCLQILVLEATHNKRKCSSNVYYVRYCAQLT